LSIAIKLCAKEIILIKMVCLPFLFSFHSIIIRYFLYILLEMIAEFILCPFSICSMVCVLCMYIILRDFITCVYEITTIIKIQNCFIITKILLVLTLNNCMYLFPLENYYSVWLHMFFIPRMLFRFTIRWWITFLHVTPWIKES
jgi:hypothetical protein